MLCITHLDYYHQTKREELNNCLNSELFSQDSLNWLEPVCGNSHNWLIRDPARTSEGSDFSEGSEVSDWSFTMGIYEKIYLELYIDNQYIWFKTNTAQLYFTLGRAELHWNFSSIPNDGSDIHRFSNRKWVSTMCTVGGGGRWCVGVGGVFLGSQNSKCQDLPNFQIGRGMLSICPAT